MQYLLTEEEFKGLVPITKLGESILNLSAVIETITKTDFCILHRAKGNSYCDSCPIASINLNKNKDFGYVSPCKYQKFSK